MQLTARSLSLPGASGPVTVDYLVCDRQHARVWVPVGETGSADVFDVATGTFTRVDGFKTAEREAHGKKRMAGPSAATWPRLETRRKPWLHNPAILRPVLLEGSRVS